MNNSIAAYTNPNNQAKFNIQKAQIYRLLLKNPNHSRFFVGKHLGISSHASQKRLSDLKNEGTIYVSGSRKHGENRVSTYSVVTQLSMYPPQKKLSFRKWAEKYHPEIVHKYEALEEFKL